MQLHRLLVLFVALCPLAARAQQVIDVRVSVDVLAFAHDDSFALALERYDTGTAVSDTYLVIQESGAVERLRLSERVRMQGARDGVSVDECERTVARLRVLAPKLAGVSVVGLCSHPTRSVVKTTQRPNPVVVTDEIGLAHQRVGFPGRTWVSPRRRYVIVIGTDMMGAPRIATTALSTAP